MQCIELGISSLQPPPSELPAMPADPLSPYPTIHILLHELHSEEDGVGARIALPAADWDRAGDLRGGLLKYLQEAIGCGTMLDSRRTVDYDSEHLVDQYLNQAEVKVGPLQRLLLYDHTFSEAIR